MIEWQTGTPSKPQWYLVALMYKNGMGTIGCATWDGDIGWSTAEGDSVIAYIPIKEVLKHNSIEWPEHLVDA